MKLTPAPVLPPLPPAEYTALLESIQALGVQVPLIVTDGGEIVDGHERFKAIQELGLNRYPLRVVGKLTTAQRRELAVRLNVERRHLTPAQKKELIEAELRSNPARSNRALAELLRCDRQTVGNARRRLEATGGIPPVDRLSRNGKLFKQPPSVGVETLPAAREAARLLVRVGKDVAGGMTLRDARSAAWQESARRVVATTNSTPTHIDIRKCDFRKLDVADESVDLILTDPPWSVEWKHLHEAMGERCYRWLKPGGLLLTYTGNASLPLFLDTFRAAGLKYRWTLASTNAPAARTGKPYGNNRYGGKFSAAFRPLLLFSKGSRWSTWKTPRDVHYLTGREEQHHPLNWQQPLQEASYWVEHFSAPGALVVDPFLGSGTNAVAVALAGGGRRFVGCDVDATCVKIARRRLSEALEESETA